MKADLNTISAILVVKDEAALIERCLKSLQGLVQEIIVVHDGPCSDTSLDIARAYGAKILIGKFWGYMEPHLVPAYEQASGEWLLRIDADEFLSDDLRRALPSLVSDSKIAAYEFNWPLFDGKKYLTKSWPEKICLFRKDKISFVALPDAPTEVAGLIKRVDYTLEHRPLKDNYAFGVFKTRWLRLARMRAELYAADFSIFPKFNSKSDDWTLRFRLRRRFPLLVLPFDCLIVFLRIVASGWHEGLIVIRVALMTTALRAAIDWMMFKQKIKI
jgi:glycosyltransferase involved in cell wall biosynthesis